MSVTENHALIKVGEELEENHRLFSTNEEFDKRVRSSGGSAEPDLVITVDLDSIGAANYTSNASIESGSVANVVAKLENGQQPVVLYKHDKVYAGKRYIYAHTLSDCDCADGQLTVCRFHHSNNIVTVQFNADGTILDVTIA